MNTSDLRCLNHTKNIRSSNFELLRIISMLFIIMHHFVCHGMFTTQCSQLTNILSHAFLPLGKIGYVVFVVLTMWFLVDSKFKFEKIIVTYLETVFYTIILAIIVTATNSVSLQPLDWVRFFIPIFGCTHGFVGIWMAFILFSPLLKIIITKINKNQALYAVIILFILQILSLVIFEIFNIGLPFYSGILFFSFCYFLIFYLKRYPIKLFNNKLILLVVFLFCWVLMFLLNTGYIRISNQILRRMIASLHNSEAAILDLIAGLCFFYLFKTEKVFRSRIINTLGSTTLGILLVHDNDLFRSFFWHKIIHVDVFANYGALIIPIIISISVCIYICLSIIDLTRKQLLERNIMKINFLNELCEKINNIFAS